MRFTSGGLSHIMLREKIRFKTMVVSFLFHGARPGNFYRHRVTLYFFPPRTISPSFLQYHFYTAVFKKTPSNCRYSIQPGRFQQRFLVEKKKNCHVSESTRIEFSGKRWSRPQCNENDVPARRDPRENTNGTIRYNNIATLRLRRALLSASKLPPRVPSAAI